MPTHCLQFECCTIRAAPRMLRRLWQSSILLWPGEPAARDPRATLTRWELSTNMAVWQWSIPTPSVKAVNYHISHEISWNCNFGGHTGIPHFQIDPYIWTKSLWYSQCLGLILWDVVKGWKWMKMASRNLWPILHGKYHHWLFGIGVKHAAAAACLTFEDLGQHFSILSGCQAGSHRIRQAAQHSAFSQIFPVLDIDIGHHTPS